MLYHFTVMIKEWNHIEWDVLNRITCSWRHDIGNTVQFSPIHIWAFIRQMNVSRIHISIDIISIFPIQYVNIYSTFLPREALSHDYIVILILYDYKAWVGNHLYIYIQFSLKVLIIISLKVRIRQMWNITFIQGHFVEIFWHSCHLRFNFNFQFYFFKFYFLLVFNFTLL
jgi:hypothetical protein